MADHDERSQEPGPPVPVFRGRNKKERPALQADRPRSYARYGGDYLLLLTGMPMQE